MEMKSNIGSWIKVGGLYPRTPLSPRTEQTPIQLLQEYGIQVTDLWDLADTFVSFDYCAEDVQKSVLFGVPINRRILIRSEPEVVCPENYRMENLDKFGLVITMGKIRNGLENNFPWPQFWVNEKESDDGILRKDKVALVCGNKLSLIEGELYSLRREVAHKNKDIALFGTDWDLAISRKLKILIASLGITVKSRHLPQLRGLLTWFKVPRNWLGAPKDKLEVLRGYKVTLVIENSATYVTEKLFDAFFARTIPIYVGADLTIFNIPNNLFVSAESTAESISNSVERALKMDHDVWRNELNLWLNSKEAQVNWDQNAVYKEVIICIQNFLKI